MAIDIGYLGAFGGGALSFLSPCVLPLVPPYLCYMAGVSVEQFRAQEGAAAVTPARAALLRSSLAFVLGFTTVFVALGAGASTIGYVLRAWQQPLAIAAGIAIVLGIIFALMELNKGLRVFTPSPTALSIGALIPFAANAPILVGAIFAALWMLVSKRTAVVYMIPLASGFIAGEALVAILVPVILWVQTLG